MGRRGEGGGEKMRWGRKEKEKEIGDRGRDDVDDDDERRCHRHNKPVLIPAAHRLLSPSALTVRWLSSDFCIISPRPNPSTKFNYNVK
ncbi:hypothetical protein PoB_005837000 [Plakobranchus ocellatus]|uniref:Uncharacterized protein n=1 Tax=Plakobranchus ocellatus TaxID=259542 RepID=A0AAV4CJ62_9GAST|nr:hypothetical protein PoB_005837000 [Plakobranchus ocellatus]